MKKMLFFNPSGNKPGIGGWKGAARPGGKLFAAAMVLFLCFASPLHATTVVTNPYDGITEITDTDPSSVSRPVSIHVVEINLTAPGISFELSPPTTPPSSYSGYVTTTQPTLAYMQQVGAQVAVNASYFLPSPGASAGSGVSPGYTNIVGLAASDGNIYSNFQTPVQNYAIVANAPGINISKNNQASIVTPNNIGSTSIYNAFAGSAQVITNGALTIPVYRDATHPNGVLTVDGDGTSYSNSNSWYNAINARTMAGLTQDGKTLVLFTVDDAGGSKGMSVVEAANYLLTNYDVYNALNCDGGGSTTLAMENPTTDLDSVLNVSSQSGGPRDVAASLAVFAEPVPIPPSLLLFGSGLASAVLIRRRRKSRSSLNS